MNKLPKEKRVQILTALVEGVSMRAVTRMAGVSINTVTKLLVDAGKAALEFNERTMTNLKLKRIQCDEIWSFVGMKEKNVPAERKGQGVGDVWTWTAIDAETKLVPCWLIGTRDAGCATEFMQDLASRLAHRVQLTTDGHKAYLSAVEDAFGGEVDYAQLVKLYGDDPHNLKPEARYSPGECCGTRKTQVCGFPDKKHVSTSFVERQNLTMRMSMRRFTRLTNAFSKKAENLAHAVALHFFNYNFCRVHKSLHGATPAMAAGITPEPASLADLVDMLD
ncbi:MAG: DDE-type integrase/transposase/recombinase [Planctomycetes bacterium]|nr:DDE-type integrase/transposase/recombinase [Planctomycetota bacterium]